MSVARLYTSLPLGRPLRGPRRTRPSARMSRLAFALASVACYVATFAVAGNGCWFDVAAAVGAGAMVSWAGATALLISTRRRGGVRPGRWLDVALSAAMPGAMLLLAAAVTNFAVFRYTGSGTLNAKVAALLFVPVHCGLLLMAGVMVAASFAANTRRLAPRPLAAGGLWVVSFAGLFCGFLALLDAVGVI